MTTFLSDLVALLLLLLGAHHRLGSGPLSMGLAW